MILNSQSCGAALATNTMQVSDSLTCASRLKGGILALEFMIALTAWKLAAQTTFFFAAPLPVLVVVKL